MFLTSDNLTVLTNPSHASPRTHPYPIHSGSVTAMCLENLRVDLTLARPLVFAEKWSATHQLAFFCEGTPPLFCGSSVFF